jgi:hypothetical protein
MIEFESGSANVYADLDNLNADEMLRKAQLAKAWPTARLATRLQTASGSRLRSSSAMVARVMHSAGEAGGLPRRATNPNAAPGMALSRSP